MTRKSATRDCFDFAKLRSDWYRANQALPRAIRQAVNGERNTTFYGFPRYWIPLFEWFGVTWRATIEPREYVPFFSEVDEQSIKRLIRRAASEGMLRTTLEATATLDPIMSDCLYILDHTVKTQSPAMLEECGRPESKRKTLLLTGWHSYGRPSVLKLEQTSASVCMFGQAALVLPCSIKRPYNRSPTHQRIYSCLAQRGYCISAMHKIVITSLGVIPEELWNSAAVLRYDAGAPDLYRLLRLIRNFFSTKPYAYVLDCSEFPPFSDLLQIAHREGLIKDLQHLSLRRSRAFHIQGTYKLGLKRKNAQTTSSSFVGQFSERIPI